MWRTIIDYEQYAINSKGEVKNLKTGRLLKNDYCKGFIRYRLCKAGKSKSFFAHRLVAEYFLPKPEKAYDSNHVNHKDGNKANNDFNNLEWITPKETMKNIVDNGLIHQTPVMAIAADGSEILKFKSIREAERVIGIGDNAIHECLKRKRNMAAGYYWHYLIANDK